MNANCKFLTNDGMCIKYKYRGPIPCKPSSKDWCEEPVTMIEPNQMCRDLSTYGNSFCYITLEQVNELINGKVIELDDGEYVNFICLRNTEVK